MISIVIPFYNEKDSLRILYQKIQDAMTAVTIPYEVIFVDDGSNDGSLSVAQEIQKNHEHVRAIEHALRMGKGEALATGVVKATGDIIVFMDADLQDDPQDITNFIQKIHDGYDLVNGVRKERKTSALLKLYSYVVNNLFLARLTGSPFTDINCGFKAMKRSVVREFALYGNNFRFLPLAVFLKGYKVTEIDVKNNMRQYGVSKFGVGKVFIGFLDTLTAYFLYKFSEKPLHFFGLYGGIITVIGGIILTVLVVERMFFGMLLYRRPMLFAGMLLVIVGVQIIATGFLGELIVYFNKKKV